MTEQEFRDSCAKFDLKVLTTGLNNKDDYYLFCQWHGISIGHYNKNSLQARITNNFVKEKFYIMGRIYYLVNADLDHTTNYLNSDKMEERFNFLIKSYKQEMINDRLKSLENDFG